MSDNKTGGNSSGGVGVAGLLGVLFVALKLTGVIGWPWAWVLAPFWIPIALWLIFIAVLFVIYVCKG